MDSPPDLTSTPVKRGFVRVGPAARLSPADPAVSVADLPSSVSPPQLRLMSQCSGSMKDIKRASLILDDGDEDGEELGISVPTTCDKQSGESESKHVRARAHKRVCGIHFLLKSLCF